MGDIRRIALFAAVVCGLGSFLAWVNVLFGSFAPFALERASLEGYVLNERLYAAATMATGLALLIALCLGDGRALSVLLARKTAVTATVAMSLCAGAILIAGGLGWDSRASLYVCATISGASWALVALRWNGLLVALPLGDSLPLILCGITAGMVFALPFPFSNAVTNGVFAAVLPVVSFGLLLLAETGYRLVPTVEYRGASGWISIGEGDGDRGAMIARVAVYALLVCFASRVPRAMLVASGRDYFGGSFFAGVSEVMSLLFVALVALAVAAGMLLPRKRDGLVVFYRLVFFLLLVSALLAFLGNGPLSVPFYFVNAGVYQLVRILIWSIAVAYGKWRPTRSLSVYCMGSGCMCIGLSLGMFLGSSPLADGIVESPAYSTLFAVVGVLVVAAAHIFVFTEMDVQALKQCFAGKNRLSFRQKCSIVAGQYGLSDREHQVMYLIATGRDIAHIQHVLNISKSTASTHRGRIYSKLGIHSKQELIDLVEAASGRGE